MQKVDALRTLVDMHHGSIATACPDRRPSMPTATNLVPAARYVRPTTFFDRPSHFSSTKATSRRCPAEAPASLGARAPLTCWEALVSRWL